MSAPGKSPESLTPDEIITASQEARQRGEPYVINLRGVDLSGAQLSGMDLSRAILCGADLTGADFSGSCLARANLQDAILVGAAFDGADLTDADLRGADLAGARVDDAVLTNARLEGACLMAIMGDPLSVTSARMDRATVERSEFTMRDIAQLVVRGAEVNENEIIPPSIIPTSHIPTNQLEIRLPPLDIALIDFDAPPPLSVRFSRDPVISERGAPSSDKEPDSLLPGSYKPPSYAPESSGPDSTPSLIPSRPPPSHRPSIIPALRAAELASRSLAADENERMPISQRRFQDLNALINAARSENAAPVSLRPMSLAPRLAQADFDFPEVGEEYLGVTIQEELRPGTTSRCFRGQLADGTLGVVRIFNPRCEGAPLQLPAFQRGLRALSRLQSERDKNLEVAQLLTVAVDQTAYVTKNYPGKSLEELVNVSMTFERAVDAICSLCRAFDRVHAVGLLVRSLRPSNVLVDGFQLILSEPDMIHLATLAQLRGDAFGYGSYSAPEELIGTGTRSPTADVFSLGKMLEYLVTGQEPLAPLGSPPLIAQRENVPKVLVDIVRRATATEPTERYQQVAELLADLEAFKTEGDRAQLLAPVHPVVPSRLSIKPLSTNPRIQEIDALLKERSQRREAAVPKPAPPSRARQIELGVALVGGIGAIFVLAALVFSPKSVDRMETLQLFLAGGVGLLAFALPRGTMPYLPYRLGSWAAIAGAVWLLNPSALASLTWKKQLSSADVLKKTQAVEGLVRIGKRNLSLASLQGVDLSGQELGSADFRGASLKGTKFDRAFLVEANFEGADVSGAEFSGANLFGAMLSSAKNLEDASCDRYTKLPRDVLCKKGYLVFNPTAPEEESVEEAAAPYVPDPSLKR